MRKLIVSVAIVGAFVIYSIMHAHTYQGIAAQPVTTSSNTPVPTATLGTDPVTGATYTPVPAPAATDTPVATSSGYKNGSFTGNSANAQWGYIQVKAIIQNGKITDVQFVQYPSDRNRSIQINQYADPILTSEAIQAQSANVSTVSGATDSSLAFIESLTNALSQAKA